MSSQPSIQLPEVAELSRSRAVCRVLAGLALALAVLSAAPPSTSSAGWALRRPVGMLFTSASESSSLPLEVLRPGGAERVGILLAVAAVILVAAAVTLRWPDRLAARAVAGIAALGGLGLGYVAAFSCISGLFHGILRIPVGPALLGIAGVLLLSAVWLLGVPGDGRAR